jgi:hypothetical protein
MNEAECSDVSSRVIAIRSEAGEWQARKIFLAPVKAKTD